LGIGAGGRKSGDMNDVRRRALRPALWSAAVLALVVGYLWSVDYRGVVLPTHTMPFLVAFGTPAALLLLRSLARMTSGRP
jgi:hypothetical protein